MAERYDVGIKVISQNGTCAAGHQVGDEWIMGLKTPEGICIGAFYALFPSAWALRYGVSFPWASDPDVATVACPDEKNPLVLELRRLRK